MGYRGIPLLFISLLAGCQSEMGVVVNGKSEYQIVVDRAAPAAERFAARELQRFIHQMSGVELALVHEAQGKPALFVGSQERLHPDWLSGCLGEEEFRLRTEKKNLYLIGGGPRGVLYAVYTLLQDYWGCRWYTPEISRIPPSRTLNLQPLDVHGAPGFEYRETFFPSSADPLWVVRNRLNRRMGETPDSLGGQYGIYPFVHTFYYLVPPEKYFAEHPEYFSLINGERRGQHAQLCLTHPEVTAIATRQVLEWIETHPDVRVISVDQNDGEGWCTCAHCQALADAEGSQAGPILHFVNAIAAEVAKQHPQVSLQTLAYHYSEVPPRSVKPAANVIIRLCRYANFCDGHPIEGCRVNRNFVILLDSWRAISHKIFVWDYLVDFAHYLLPFPNLDGIKQDLCFYKNHGVTGLFEQGSYPRKGSEWADLRAWVVAQLLWRPCQDADALFDDYLTQVYGSAKPFLTQYIELVHEKVRQDSIHFNLYASPQVGYLTPDIVAQAEALFQQAETAVAQDSVLLARVELAHLPVLYARLFFYSVGGKIYLSDDEMPAVAKKFLRICRLNNVSQLAETNREGTPERFIEEVKNTHGDFWTSWWLVGPFPLAGEAGLAAPYQPEVEFDTTRSYAGVDGDALHWQRYQNPNSGYIHFNHIFQKSEMGVAYARREFTAAREAEVAFGFGSNDGIRAWLNGRLILDRPVRRLAAPNQEIVRTHVRKGANTLLLKIDQFGGGWGFYCTLLEGKDVVTE